MRRRTSRGRLLSLSSLIVCGVAGLSATLPGWAAGTQKVTVWVQDQSRQREFEFIASLFEEKNPGVDVEVLMVPGSQAEFTQKLSLAIVSGSPPDITWMEGSAVREFAAQGLLLDVTRTLAGLRFTPSDTEEMTFNGRLWGVPYHTTSRGLFKRADFFAQAGLDAAADPASLDELYQWNLKLTVRDSDGRYQRAGMVPWVGNWGAPGWIWAFGGELLEIQGRTIRPTANRPENVAAFEWIRTWAAAVGNRSPVGAGATGFRAGTVAMSTESTSIVGQLLAAEVPFRTGRVPHPPGGRNGTWGGGQALSVPKNSPHPELALRLLRFFGETDVQIQRFRRFPDVLPANWQALLTVGRELPAVYGPLLDQLPEARPRPPLWLDYYVGQLNPAMSAVVAGKKTPVQALNEVQTFMENRYAEVFGR